MYKEKWYEKTWVIITFLILLFPVGVLLMWANKYEWEDKNKKAITIIGSILFVFALIIIFTPSKANNKVETTKTSNISSTQSTKEEDKSKLKIYYFSAMSSDGVVGNTIGFNNSVNEVGNVKYQYSYVKDGVTTIVKDYSNDKNFSWVATESGYYIFYLTIKNDDGEEIKSSSTSVKIISKEEYETKASQKAQEDANKQKAQAEAVAKAQASTECKNALKKAQQYSQSMSMSKQGIYDQLISAYGEKFSVEAAQYAINNLQADYKQNALKKAKQYSESMSMSRQGIYDQLISEHGEKFTPEEAQYAIDNLK